MISSKSLLLPFFLSIFFLHQTEAQQVQLNYKFTKGKKLYYHRTYDQTDEQTSRSGKYEDSFINSMDVMIEVNEVESNGNMTLTFFISNEKYQAKGEALSLKPGRFEGRPYTSPKFRVTISPYGEYRSGEIMEDTQERIAEKEKLKQPGVQGWMISDEDLLKYYMDVLIRPLPIPDDLTIGISTIDSSMIVKPEPYERTLKTVTTYLIEEFTNDIDVPCVKFTERKKKNELSIHKDSPGGYFDFEWDTITISIFRKSDGLLLQSEETTTSTSTNVTTDGKGKASAIVSLKLLREE